LKYKDLFSDQKGMEMETCLSEIDLLKFNKVIRRDMDLIACLGLSQVEIDRLKIENPHSLSTVVHKILLTWKRKHGQAATLQNLEEALKDAESDTGAYIDWGAFSQAKERLLRGQGLGRSTVCAYMHI
jgi:hypothetical protein